MNQKSVNYDKMFYKEVIKVKIDFIKVGYLKTNCYLLEKSNNYLLIDPGEDLPKIDNFIKGKNIVGILATHSHFDHIASINDLVKKYNYKVYNDTNLKEGINKIGDFKFELIQTPGHTMDSITIYFRKEKMMFTGDFLFKGTIGRCDLAGGNYQLMSKSIDIIKNYDNDIKIFPGHGVIKNSTIPKYNKIYNKSID